ncbi:melanoma-associated antigen B4-like [Psammomys obesus]|uniref:melanoma-associated antigen B4-like n=1 Tax=Psammomys obesus TaxID=48139 RepID=UPI002452AFAC|nr:melanoma-associated antigen B4-like [Psammomys obesus]
MPRGNKSKRRSRAKRQQMRAESKNIQDDLPPEAEEETAPPFVQKDAPSFPDVRPTQESQEASSHESPELNVSQLVYDAGAEGAEGFVAGADATHSNISIIADAIQSALKGRMTGKTNKIFHYLLEKYQMDEQPMDADMLKLISRKHKVRFPWILKKATYNLELVYGLELKVDNPNTHTYVLVSKLPIPPGSSVGGKKQLPKTGLILTLLGMIYMKGNHATEEEVWQFLHMMGIYPGRRHLICGEPRNFITKELVEQNYVKYRQVVGSDPPRYEFLWGSRAHDENTKVKVMEVLRKIREAIPSYNPQQYDETLSNQGERADRDEAPGDHAARIPSYAHSSSSSHT